jgi:hypothetical protein
VLGRDLGVLGRERLVDARPHRQLVREALEVGEAQRVALRAVRLHALGRQPLLPEVQRGG